MSFVPEILKFGGLGVLALLCLVVLGQNAWNLNSLVKNAEPKRIAAARPLLLAQMSISIFGLVAVGAGAILLERLRVEDQRVRTAQVSIEPWNSDLDQRFWPTVLLSGEPLRVPFEAVCEPNGRTRIGVNFRPYLNHLITRGNENRIDLEPPTLRGGG